MICLSKMLLKLLHMYLPACTCAIHTRAVAMPRTRHSTEEELEAAVIGSGRGTIQRHRTRGMFAEVPRRTETEATTRAFHETRLSRAIHSRGISRENSKKKRKGK